jgi:hypothetical protein
MDGCVRVYLARPSNDSLLGINYRAGARRVCPTDHVLPIVLLYVEMLRLVISHIPICYLVPGKYGNAISHFNKRTFSLSCVDCP